MFDPYTRNKGNVSPYNPRVFSKLKLNHVKPHSEHSYSVMETMENDVMGYEDRYCRKKASEEGVSELPGKSIF